MGQGESSTYQALLEACRSFTSRKEESGTIHLKAFFYFDEEFPGFQGHFPGNPVLPAVVQLAAVRTVAEMSVEQKLAPVCYERVKFRGIITPGGPTEVRIELDQDGDGWSGGFTIKNCEGESVAEGRCSFINAVKG